ncbi:MAG TPA: CBS domain-containing protein [Candidatus Acidoferrales bacterium]|nr:CBS domain-containing protein [Candidatus Acidoferrales bacterium]
MQIVNLMTPNPIVINSDDTLANAKAVMDRGRFRRLPVVDQEKLVGIVTERDVREHTGYLGSTRVNAAMRTALITVSPYATVEEAARLMLGHKIGGLPILDEGKLVGIVTTSDLLKALLVVVRATQHIMDA